MAEDGPTAITLFPSHRGADSDGEDSGTRSTLDLSLRRYIGARPGSPDRAGKATAVSATGSCYGLSGTPASGSARRKPRGRPRGSKNKPKQPVVISRENEWAMRSVVLHLSVGCNILHCISAFVHQRRVGVSIIGSSGLLRDVTLRHPLGSDSTLTFPGPLQILSLSGILLEPATAANMQCSYPSSSMSPAMPHLDTPITVSLLGSHGQVIGGVVAGELVADGPVMLLLASFVNPEIQNLTPPPVRKEEGGAMIMAEETKQVVRVGAPLDPSPLAMVHNVNQGGGVKCEMPSEGLPWSSKGNPGPAGQFPQSLDPRLHF